MTSEREAFEALYPTGSWDDPKFERTKFIFREGWKAARQDWQPISAAPKKGNVIMLAKFGKYNETYPEWVKTAFANQGGSFCKTLESGMCPVFIEDATHWAEYNPPAPKGGE